MTFPWLPTSPTSLTLVMSALPALFASPGLLPLPLPGAAKGPAFARPGTCGLARFDAQSADQPAGNAAAIRGCVQLEDAQQPPVGGLGVGFVGEPRCFLTGWTRLAPLPGRHLPSGFSERYARSMNGPLQAGWSVSDAAEVPRGFRCSWAVAGDGPFHPPLRTPCGANPTPRSFPFT